MSTQVDSDHVRALLRTIQQGYRLVRTEEDFKALPPGASGYFSNYMPQHTFSKMPSGLWYCSTGRTESSDFEPPMPFTRHDQKDLMAELVTYVELLLDNQDAKG